MRRQLLKLATLVFLAVGSPAYADPACGSDTSADPIEAMGKDIWLTDYCKSFIPCRLAYEQFRGCRATETFLSNLGAKEGQPLTEVLVEDAVVRTRGTASGSVPRMAKISASIERDRVASLDSSTVATLQSDCADRGCMNYREKQLNFLGSEVEKLNGNVDILYWFPEYAPVQAFAAAERLGWTRQNGQWVFGGIKEGTTTLGHYLLNADDCKKLQSRLDQEIKTTPANEPVELSLFEAECLPQLPDARAVVAAWRKNFSALPAVSGKWTPEQTSAQGDLAQWNQRQIAEQSRYEAQLAADADAEARLRQAEETERRMAEQRITDSSKLRRTQGSSTSSNTDMCLRNLDKASKIAADSIGEAFGASPTYGFMARFNDLQLQILAPCAKKNGEVASAMRQIEFFRGVTESACSRGCKEWGEPDEVAKHQTWFRAFEREAQAAISDPKGYFGGLSSVPSRGSSTLINSDTKCEAEFKEIDDRVGAASSGCGESASCNLQAAMWGLTQQINTIESNCPSGRFAAELSKTKLTLESISTTCNQIVSGGRCSPRL